MIFWSSYSSDSLNYFWFRSSSNLVCCCIWFTFSNVLIKGYILVMHLYMCAEHWIWINYLMCKNHGGVFITHSDTHVEYYICIHTHTHYSACYLHIVSIWSLSLLCIHAYYLVQCIYYYRSQPKQVLLEAVKLVDMEKELELELEKELELVLEKEGLEMELVKVEGQQ